MRKLYILAIIVLLCPLSKIGANNTIGVVGTDSDSFLSLDNGSDEFQDFDISRSYIKEWRKIRDKFNLMEIQPKEVDFTIENRRDQLNFLSQKDLKMFSNPYTSDSKICLCDSEEEISTTSIFIDGNEEFDAQGFPGSGTEDDPYVINNFNFSDPEVPYLLWIQNTTVFFEARNINFFGNSPQEANLFLNNVSNANIHHNFLEDSMIGILIVNSDNIVVENNDLQNHDQGIVVQNSFVIELIQNSVTLGGDGILIDGSTDILVDSNTISDNSGNGLVFAVTSLSEITGNTISYNGGDGIILIDSNDNAISSNEVFGNYASGGEQGFTVDSTTTDKFTLHAGFGGVGIFLDPSINNNIENNKVYDNEKWGVYLQESDSSIIVGNEIQDNGFSGIFLEDSNNNNIRANLVQRNGYSESRVQFATNNLELITYAGFGGVGIYLDPSFGNTLEDNEVYDNYGNGILLEASENTVISNNDVDNNGLSGIFLFDSHSNVISKNVASNNGQLMDELSYESDFELITYAGFGGVGIYLDPSHGNIIDDNNVFGNVGNGILLEYSTNTIISNNDVDSNGLAGIILNDSNDNLITKNAVSFNGQTASSLSIMSTGSPIEQKIFAGFGGVGIYLDPSDNNVVEGNIISGNVGPGTIFEQSNNNDLIGNIISNNGDDGVSLLSTSNSKISQNIIFGNGGFSSDNFASITTQGEMNLYAGFGGVGIFLDPSLNNEISNNSIFDNKASGMYLLESNDTQITYNNLTDNGAHGVFLQDSSHNNITGNNVTLNGYALDNQGLSLSAGFGGVGIYLDPSWFNIVDKNFISKSADDGIFSEGSHFTEITNNVFKKNFNYGLNLDKDTSNSKSEGNDYLDNGGDGSEAKAENSQAKDDGVSEEGNTFTKNFWKDHAVPSEEYRIAGAALSADRKASPYPLRVPLVTVEADFKPESLNTVSQGQYVKFIVTLPEGYALRSIDLRRLFLNRTYTPVRYEIDDDQQVIRKFELFFNRADVNELVNNLGMKSKFLVTLELAGAINGLKLAITGNDIVRIVRTVHDRGSKVAAAAIGIGGILLIVPISERLKSSGKKKQKLT